MFVHAARSVTAALAMSAIALTAANAQTRLADIAPDGARAPTSTAEPCAQFKNDASMAGMKKETRCLVDQIHKDTAAARAAGDAADRRGDAADRRAACTKDFIAEMRSSAATLQKAKGILGERPLASVDTCQILEQLRKG